jgi:hypothetical protein
MTHPDAPARCLVLDGDNMPTVEAMMQRGITREAAEELHAFAARLREKQSKKQEPRHD